MQIGARCIVHGCMVRAACCVVRGAWCMPLGRSTDALAYGEACGNIPGPDNSLHEWLARAAIVPSNGLLAIGSFSHRNEPDGLTYGRDWLRLAIRLTIAHGFRRMVYKPLHIWSCWGCRMLHAPPISIDLGTPASYATHRNAYTEAFLIHHHHHPTIATTVTITITVTINITKA